MILSSLNDYYHRLLEQGKKYEGSVSSYGYSHEKISYEILLSVDGTLIGVNDIRNTSGRRPVPRDISVPQPCERSSDIRSNFLWDKSSYVLGVSATS